MLQPNPPRLSKAALETLAIIAYKQPIIRADIEHIRGVDSGGILRLLLKRKLVRVLGRKEIPGRPLIYATTKRFLEIFDLRDLKDLPTPKEIEELGSEASDELAAAFEALEVPPEGPTLPAEPPAPDDAQPPDLFEDFPETAEEGAGEDAGQAPPVESPEGGAIEAEPIPAGTDSVKPEDEAESLVQRASDETDPAVSEDPDQQSEEDGDDRSTD